MSNVSAISKLLPSTTDNQTNHQERVTNLPSPSPQGQPFQTKNRPDQDHRLQ